MMSHTYVQNSPRPLRVHKRRSGFTLTEIAISLAIVVILAGLMVATMSGLRGKDSIDRAIEGIKNDLLLMRSRSVSTNANHRLRFITSTEWVIEQYNEGPGTWSIVGETRSMPSDTYLTSDAFTNAGSKLEATSRGLFQLNGANGDPYVTVSALGETRVKSIVVAIGGAIEVRAE